MKYIVTILIGLIFLVFPVQSQALKPTSISASYLGETVTHPGFTVGISYDIKNWTKTRSGKYANEIYTKSLTWGPSGGLYYHKNYQTGIFLLPELNYSREKEKGKYISAGIGMGFLRTIIPNAYSAFPNSEPERIREVNNYFLNEFYLEFGRSLEKVPVDIFVKPVFLYALPNFQGGVAYICLEIGCTFNLDL